MEFQQLPENLEKRVCYYVPPVIGGAKPVEVSLEDGLEMIKSVGGRLMISTIDRLDRDSLERDAMSGGNDVVKAINRPHRRIYEDAVYERKRFFIMVPVEVIVEEKEGKNDGWTDCRLSLHPMEDVFTNFQLAKRVGKGKFRIQSVLSACRDLRDHFFAALLRRVDDSERIEKTREAA